MSSTKLLSNSVSSAIYGYIENSVKGNKNYPNTLLFTEKQQANFEKHFLSKIFVIQVAQPRKIYRDLAFSVTQMLATHRDAAGKQLVIGNGFKVVQLKFIDDYGRLKLKYCLTKNGITTIGPVIDVEKCVDFADVLLYYFYKVSKSYDIISTAIFALFVQLISALKGEVKSQYSIEYLSVPFIYLSNFSPISSTGELCALVPYWRTFIGEDNIAGLICPEDGDVGERPMLGLRLGKPSICERLVPVINATGLPRGEL
ncbi:hypothetical protein T01_796 [Trichinella spiralis]|uniref:Uncharacterized protein n=1 Tax=Trichinella spiralis TaxID=6334 RepID=A0A0V1BAF5_TRISP|nr:hypothetical protein T01_796 [Trichinella spiralis]